jgi:H+/gluconate symporter-like permease
MFYHKCIKRDDPVETPISFNPSGTSSNLGGAGIGAAAAAAASVSAKPPTPRPMQNVTPQPMNPMLQAAPVAVAAVKPVTPTPVNNDNTYISETIARPESPGQQYYQGAQANAAYYQG